MPRYLEVSTLGSSRRPFVDSTFEVVEVSLSRASYPNSESNGFDQVGLLVDRKPVLIIFIQGNLDVTVSHVM